MSRHPMLDARLRKNLDLPLLVLTLLIVTMGIVTIFSATRESPAHYYQKQVFWFAMGLAGMVAAATIDYSRLARLSKPLYVANLAMLLIVMRFGNEAKGATRWFRIGSFQLQPSEFAKLIIIICLASWLSHRQERIRELPVLIASFVLTAIPTGLIFRQPDLGTALVIISIWFGMTFIAGARVQHLALFALTGLLLFGAMWRFDVLKPYQKNRLAAFMQPEIDPRDAGYHVIQSRIAVGSGEVWGKGMGQGTQVQGKFIPENHTDFIFTVIGEEGGFVLSALLVLLYGALLLRGTLAMTLAEDTFGRLLAAGIVSMYAFHIIVNIGMTIGIMPVTGVPLPLFSYGGSNLLLNLSAVGLLLGIGMRRHRLVF